MSSDPLLQPFKLRLLTLRNRIMTTSHEPASCIIDTYYRNQYHQLILSTVNVAQFLYAFL